MGGLLAAQNAPRGVPYVGPSMQQNKLFVYFWLMVMGGSWESTYIEGITVSAVEVGGKATTAHYIHIFSV
jgi:hypothetical protein